jgi:hypothetical protein
MEALELPFPDVLHKSALEENAKLAGLEVPSSRSFPSWTELVAARDELSYPIIVKPMSRGLAAETVRLDSSSAMEATSPVDGELMVQPYLTQDLIAVSGVMWKGRLVAAVHEKWLRIFPYPCGTASAAETISPDVTLEVGLERLLGSYDGLFQAQFAGPYLFDVNLRVPASHPLAIKAGVNLVSLYCDLMRGENVADVRGTAGHRFRWIEGDMRHLLGGVRNGRISKMAALGAALPRLGTAHSTESITDPTPMVQRLKVAKQRMKNGEHKVGVA